MLCDKFLILVVEKDSLKTLQTENVYIYILIYMFIHIYLTFFVTLIPYDQGICTQW